MGIAQQLIKRALPRIAALLPKKVIRGRDGTVYLERFFVCGDLSVLRFFPNEKPRLFQRALGRLPLIYLHHFLRGDEAEELHNHPWTATSLILTGGYREERRHPNRDIASWKKFSVISAYLYPGDVNHLEADTFHRVDMIDGDCWTVIRIGEKSQSWGFWNRWTGTYQPWREFFKEKGIPL